MNHSVCRHYQRGLGKKSMDFKEPSGGGYLLVVYDDYTRYPVVEVVNSVSSKAVIRHATRSSQSSVYQRQYALTMAHHLTAKNSKNLHKESDLAITE